jgi:hypothetical protein
VGINFNWKTKEIGDFQDWRYRSYVKGEMVRIFAWTGTNLKVAVFLCVNTIRIMGPGVPKQPPSSKLRQRNSIPASRLQPYRDCHPSKQADLIARISTGS